MIGCFLMWKCVPFWSEVWCWPQRSMKIDTHNSRPPNCYRFLSITSISIYFNQYDLWVIWRWIPFWQFQLNRQHWCLHAWITKKLFQSLTSSNRCHMSYAMNAMSANNGEGRGIVHLKMFEVNSHKATITHIKINFLWFLFVPLWKRAKFSHPASLNTAINKTRKSIITYENNNYYWYFSQLSYSSIFTDFQL